MAIPQSSAALIAEIILSISGYQITIFLCVDAGIKTGNGVVVKPTVGAIPLNLYGMASSYIIPCLIEQITVNFPVRGFIGKGKSGVNEIMEFVVSYGAGAVV